MTQELKQDSSVMTRPLRIVSVNLVYSQQDYTYDVATQVGDNEVECRTFYTLRETFRYLTTQCWHADSYEFLVNGYEHKSKPKGLWDMVSELYRILPLVVQMKEMHEVISDYKKLVIDKQKDIDRIHKVIESKLDMN